MIKLFIIWIILQLLAIGWITADINNDIVRGSYNCPGRQSIQSHEAFLIFPLAVFVPESPFWTQYCDKLRAKYEKMGEDELKLWQQDESIKDSN